MAEFIRTSTECIRGAVTGEQNVPVKPEQFDDWLARHDAEIQAQAQQDLITDLLGRDLWSVRYALNDYPIEAVPKSALLERRNRLARLTTAKEPS